MLIFKTMPCNNVFSWIESRFLSKNKLLSLYPQFQDQSNGGIKISTNKNHMWTTLIQTSTMTSKSIKIFWGILHISNGKWHEKCMSLIIHRTINKVEDNFHFLLSWVTWQILFQYIEDSYTIISYVYWAWNLSHGI